MQNQETFVQRASVACGRNDAGGKQTSQPRFNAPAIERLNIPALELVERGASRRSPRRRGDDVPPGDCHGGNF